MGYFQWINGKIKTMTWVDISALKWCVAAFVLMVAKLWPPLLSLSWYCYGGVFVVLYVYLIYKIYVKK